MFMPASDTIRSRSTRLQSALVALLFAGSPIFADAQQYEPNWESLDTRETPTWWTDAKFGIFIHWGVYAVPAFSKVGEYSEWYNKYIVDGRPPYKEYHEARYGKDFAYADFVPDFKADMFDPDHWADVFRRSGARYVVLTSKHHDGFTLWKSEEANRSWGRPWNSVDVGPQRDLLGDLTESVRKAGLEMGIYYSIYEWFNPIYNTDRSVFVDSHYIPQFKDVVTKYEPSIIFSDGEWEGEAEEWKSQEVLAWLYNESPVKDKVVANDRWGRGTRHKHGDYYTTEYTSGMDSGGHAWEESRGMAHSYGYSRTENIDDYNTGQQLVLMLVDIVSRGGNLLLDIGPTADGRIPVIMQERLLEIGRWMEVNGEAIYGTTSSKHPVQWTAGRMPEEKRGDYMVQYDILQLTVDPPEGQAAKELFFTRKGDDLYAIAPRWPEGELTVKGIGASAKSRVTLLGRAGELKSRRRGSDLVITIPTVNPDEMRGMYAYVFKITDVRE